MDDPGFDSHRGQQICLLLNIQTVSGPIRPAVQLILGSVFPMVNWPEYEVGCSCPPSAIIRSGAVPVLPYTVMVWTADRFISPYDLWLFAGIGSQKKDQSNQLGNSAPASDSPTKSVASVTTPSTPTTIRDMASPSSTSGGSRSGNNSARSTPATVSSTSIMQEPNSPQLHFNTPTSASSTTLENRSPVQYNAPMTANPTPLDPKSPLQYGSSTAGGNSSSSTAPPHQYNTSAATSSNFAAGTPSTPQSSIIPQTSYEPMMLGGYPAGAGGSGYAPPPPPPPPPPPGMGYGSYSNPANQYEADYARASMYSAFHRPDPHPHPFAPGHPPGFLPPPQSANYYPQNMYGPAPYGTPDPAYYNNPFLNAMHQHPYPTLPGTAQNPGPHSQ